MGPRLELLARAYGVWTSYEDNAGLRHLVAASTVRAVLAAMGVPAGDPEQVEAALTRRRVEPWRRILPGAVVLRQGAGDEVRVHVPVGSAVAVRAELEDGTTAELGAVPGDPPTQDVEGVQVLRRTFRVPAGLPTGWHALHAVVDDQEHAITPLVLTPDRLRRPGTAARGWGFGVQLYALRSRASWGLGDLADLADLARWSGRDLGADFVLINPVHAAVPGPPREPSPYLPATRRFADPAYLRVEAIGEYERLTDADRAHIGQLRAPLMVADTTAQLLDRDAAWAAKSDALHCVYRVTRSPLREAGFRAYLDREGAGLDDFALWCALAEAHGPMPTWPAALLDPSSEAVAGERVRLADRVHFHRWCQWVLDEQLGQAQRTALDAGMGLGVLHDLAVGVHPHGADAWSLGEVLANGVSVGAPPDDYSAHGQDWSQPPWLPDALAAKGFAPYRDMLRTVLRHAGGIRVDHVMGLFRLWWIPAGMPPSQGTYVSYDHEAMLGIVTLEAERRGVAVIGEDLGTVEPWVRRTLADRGVLGTSVLWFERDRAGRPRRPGQWRRDCLAAVTTHDLPPTAGYLAGEHLRVRGSLGLLPGDPALAWAAHEAQLRDWLAVLARDGLLAEGADEAQVVEALHRFVLRTPSRLFAVALTDAVGQHRAQNQPGTSVGYPNWCVPLTGADGVAVLLEDLPTDPRLRSLAGLLVARGPGGTIRA